MTAQNVDERMPHSVVCWCMARTAAFPPHAPFLFQALAGALPSNVQQGPQGTAAGNVQRPLGAVSPVWQRSAVLQPAGWTGPWALEGSL